MPSSERRQDSPRGNFACIDLHPVTDVPCCSGDGVILKWKHRVNAISSFVRSKDPAGVFLSPTLNKQFRWFLRQLRPLLRAHLFSVSLVVLSSLMFLLDPLLIKWLIDSVLPKKDLHLLLLAAAGFLGLYSCRLGLSALSVLVSFRTMH